MARPRSTFNNRDLPRRCGRGRKTNCRKDVGLMASVISRLVLICGLLVCLCIGVNAQTARPKAVPSANAEGQKAAQYLWNSIFTKCGDAWYYSGSEPDVVGSVPGGSCSAWDVRMWSYKGVRFKLSRLPLSSADALNGVSWRGVA